MCNGKYDVIDNIEALEEENAVYRKENMKLKNVLEIILMNSALNDTMSPDFIKGAEALIK